MFLAERGITSIPSFEVFYQDVRVASVTGPQVVQVR